MERDRIRRRWVLMMLDGIISSYSETMCSHFRRSRQKLNTEMRPEMSETDGRTLDPMKAEETRIEIKQVTPDRRRILNRHNKELCTRAKYIVSFITRLTQTGCLKAPEQESVREKVKRDIDR